MRLLLLTLLLLATAPVFGQRPAPESSPKPSPKPSPQSSLRSAAAAPPTLFTTYTYLTYAILDKGTSPRPLPAQGVGGTLTLRPDGTYQKHLMLAANGTVQHFDQEGRFSLTPGRIAFTHPDQHGTSRTDAGTFRLVGRLLTVTLEGYPAGNQSIYTLRAR